MLPDQSGWPDLIVSLLSAPTVIPSSRLRDVASVGSYHSRYRDKPVIMIFPILLPFSLGFK